MVYRAKDLKGLSLISWHNFENGAQVAMELQSTHKHNASILENQLQCIAKYNTVMSMIAKMMQTKKMLSSYDMTVHM